MVHDTDPPADPAPPSVGAVQEALPQFEVLKLIGAGGMGAVYKARQPKLDRLVAIKLLSAEISADGNFEKRFLSEAQAMAKMMHNRIVTVYDFGETGQGWLYIVMEFVEGQDLNHLIENKALSHDHALAVATQICDALAYAHERHLVHQDIKPANIMLDVEGQVKVADFGLAKMVAAGDTGTPGERTVPLMGSPDYVAPERLEEGKEGDHRADIYSLGVTLYEMLTGETPRGNYIPPSQRNPELDPRIDPIVARAMAHDLDARYQNVTELWHDIDRIRTSPRLLPKTGPATTAPPKTTYAANAQPETKSKGKTIAVTAAVILGGVAALLAPGLIDYLSGPDEPDPPEVATPETPPPVEPATPEVAVAPTPGPGPDPDPTETTTPEPAPPTPEPQADPSPGTAEQVAAIIAKHTGTYHQTLTADLNDYYRSALEREITTQENAGQTAVVTALKTELETLDAAPAAPLVTELPVPTPPRLTGLRKIYTDSLETKKATIAGEAADIAAALDAELKSLQNTFLADNKKADARAVADARTALRDDHPFFTGDAATADAPVPGRFRGWGETAKGEAFDVSATTGFDDFVAVDYHMEDWAAVRSNGQVFSSKRRIDGLAGVAQTVLTGPRTYVRYLDGTVASIPGFDKLPDDIDNAVDLAIGIGDGIARIADGSIVAWGNSFSKPGNGPPGGLSNVVDIAATWGSFDNPSYGFALLAGGKVLSWGRPDKPFDIPADLPPVKQIEAGWTQLVCLTEDGEVINLPRPGDRAIKAPDDLPPAVKIQVKGPFYAAQDAGGVWRAWGHNRFGVVDKVNEIGRAHAITFKGNRWHGVFWIEPLE